MSKHNLKTDIQKYNQLHNQIRREKEKERKQRTHQLIQKGALLEKYFNLQEVSPEDTEVFLKNLKEKMSD